MFLPVAVDFISFRAERISNEDNKTIVCLAGMFAVIPIALQLCAEKTSIFSNAVRDAIALNFQPADEKQSNPLYNQRQTHDENFL